MTHFTYDRTCRLQRVTGSNGVSFALAANGSAVLTHDPDGTGNAIAFLPDLLPRGIADNLDPNRRLCVQWYKYKAKGGTDLDWQHC